ncbi:MAG: hypothetical protein AAF602_22565 [Myxococcota bacterium]
MARRRGKGDDIDEDEDALVTMIDQPILDFLDDEDDSDLASTQLEWVSPLDPRFGDGKPVEPPERFPADEPLTPPRRLAPDFAAKRPLPDETDPAIDEESESDQTALRPVPPGLVREALESREDLSAADLVPDEIPPIEGAEEPTRPRPTPSAESRKPVPSGERRRRPTPSGERRRKPTPSGERRRKPTPSGERRRDVPSLERRMDFDRHSGRRPRRSSDTEPMRALSLVIVGLVVSVLAALLVLALAVGWWLAAG